MQNTPALRSILRFTGICRAEYVSRNITKSLLRNSPLFRIPCVSSVSQKHTLKLFHTTAFQGREREFHKDPRTGAKIPPAGPQPGGNDPNEVFTDMNVLAGSPPPASAIEIVFEDGFLLNNGMKLRDNSGLMIVHNEAFRWVTAGAVKVNKGVIEFDDELWGILSVVSPKPELLVLGTGDRSLPLSPKTKNYLHSLGIRIDSMDTGNAASSYNMLATERPGQIVAAAMLPASFQ